MKNNAFTLAEVLITLGIIGIIAAMTLPALIQKNHKTIVETRLKKFYSAINQAILLSENANGDKKYWTPSDTEEFWDLYLKKYLNYINIEKYKQGSKTNIIVYFEDGSAAIIDIYFAQNDDGENTWQTTGGHFIFCPEAKNCRQKHYEKFVLKERGIKNFVFGFWPNETSRGANFDYHKNKGVEPYKVWWDGNEESLYENCKETDSRMYCAAIIQDNGWRVPDDYPFKF